MKTMNDAQIQALAGAQALLREHFDASVLVVAYDTYFPNDPDEKECHQTAYHGGFSRAIGLLTLGARKMVATPSEQDRPDPPEDWKGK